MKQLLPKIGLILLVLFLVVNLFWLDYTIFWKQEAALPETKSVPTTSSPSAFEVEEELVSQDSCGPICQATIAEEVAQAVATISGKETVTEKTVERILQPTSAPQTLYLALGSGGSTTSTAWADVAGSVFLFDLADYRSGTDIFWQANLKAEHSNSRCFGRIYDVTNNRAIDFSEQTTDQTSFQTLTSLKLSVWSGKNTYRLQLKSLNGINCSLGSPRLTIIDQS